MIRDLDIFNLESSIWVAVKPIGVSAYDFQFEPIFICRRPYIFPSSAELICRVGAFEDYHKTYELLREEGFSLINSVEEYFRASELEQWYRLIKEYTPGSICYEKVPTVYDIENNFDYPVFIKGSRQTAKHSAKLSIARNRKDCAEILKEYQSNAIRHWQKLVCREFVALMPVEAKTSHKISASFEFRRF